MTYPEYIQLSPLSKDEGVVTQFFLNDHVDKLLNILDASQLKRNLHLTIQILEYEKPVVIGLNMVDVAKKRGIEIDVESLSALLGITVIPIVARSGKDCDLLAKVITENQEGNTNQHLIDYGKVMDEAVEKLQMLLEENKALPIRWLTLQLQNFPNEKAHCFSCGMKVRSNQACLQTRSWFDFLFDISHSFIRTGVLL